MLRFAIILAAVAACHAQMRYRYGLYTKETENPAIFTSNDNTLPEVFDPEHKTIILIHGHGGSPGDRFDSLIRREIFLNQEEHNVIVVDWQTAASGSYASARSFVESVANDLASLLKNFSPPSVSGFTGEVETTPPGTGDKYVLIKRVHMVGFGLGAHIAGIAGRQLRPNIGIPARITGLDPSGNQWNSNSPRLTESDADYVEVIHTDGSGLLAHGIGTNLGHVNFHANGGSNQPGCFSHTCSHERAFELFAATMRGNHLVGRACSSNSQLNLNLCRGVTLSMGGTDLSKRIDNRIYRVNTGRTFPFL